MSWFGRLFGRGGSQAGEAALASPAVPDPRAAAERDVLEALQRLTRAQAKLAMRVEELDSKLEGGFADLRAGIEEVGSAAPADELEWGELLDAVDLLQEAVRQAGSDPSLSEGLAGVIVRIERFLAQAGLERLAGSGDAPDGRLFRVIGAEPAGALPEGVVARVVRAAVLRGDEIMREGEVIVTRKNTSTTVSGTGVDLTGSGS